MRMSLQAIAISLTEAALYVSIAKHPLCRPIGFANAPDAS